MAIAHATVNLDTNASVGPLDRRLFGGFLEHVGRAVYGGVFDPGNPLSDARGFRRDVIAALRPLGMGVIRYPGGNYVSGHDWRDGVGPRANRPRRPDHAWQSIETNHFGTDEFLAWCSELGAAPMLAVNLGTLGAAEAGQLVEYCNVPAGTTWSDLRRENGHSNPYGVKLWCLGNEMDGPWQLGHVPADVYAQRALEASALMKKIDDRIETVACGSSGNHMPTYLAWDRTVLERCWPTIDYISAHRYSDNSRNDTPWFLAEGVEIDQTLADYAALIADVRAKGGGARNVYVCFDEWNVWYRQRGPAAENGNWQIAPPLLEEVYNLEDALVCAQYLSAFVRRADLVKIACVAQIVNALAPIVTRSDGVLLQPIYYPLMLFSQNATGESLTPQINAPTYRAGDRGEVPALDVSATLDTGNITVFLVNRDVSREMRVELRIVDRRATRVIGADAMGGGDVKADNRWNDPARVRPRPADAVITDTGAVNVTVPAPGFACIRVATVDR